MNSGERYLSRNYTQRVWLAQSMRRIVPLLAVLASSLIAAPAAQGQGLEFDVGPTSVPAVAAEPALIGPDGPPAADGGPLAGPVLASAEAAEILDEAEAAVAGEPGAPDPTIALNQLGQIMPALAGTQRERGETLMARPTDGAADPEGDGYTRPSFAIASPHFCVFYTKVGPDAVPQADRDANGLPDFAEAMLTFAEKSYRRQHGALGWRKPLSDGRRGCRTTPDDGKSRIDIYAVDLPGLYGYAQTDPRQRGNRRFSYLVLDNDMVEITRYTNKLQPLAVTASHEYNHVVQFSYDFIQDPWMFESTATAYEELVFPRVNDYLQYLPDVANRVSVPLTSFGNNLKPYGSVVWNYFLMKRHGARVVPRSWARSLKTNPQSFAALAYDQGIRGVSRGRSNFAKEFVKFAASLPEWRGSGIYPDSNVYPSVDRSGTMRVGGGKRLVLDHTTYRLLRVRAGGRVVKLRVRAPRRIASGLALVGRLPNGRLVKAVKVLGNGGGGTVRLSRPGRFSRITAVVVNADFDQRGYSGRIGDWIYTGNDKPFSLRLTR